MRRRSGVIEKLSKKLSDSFLQQVYSTLRLKMPTVRRKLLFEMAG